jgi:hypothetical protein
MIVDSRDGMSQRLSQLEKANAWWRRACFVVLVFSASAALVGQAQSTDKVIEAERIVLKDATGRMRATLGPHGDKGGTMLEFYGSDGNALAALGILVDGKNGVGTTLWLKASSPNPTGGQGSLLATVSSTDARFTLSYGKESGASTGSLQARDEGLMFNISDDHGNVGTTLSSGQLALADREGHARVGLFLARDGSPNFRLLDQKGNSIWQVP